MTVGLVVIEGHNVSEEALRSTSLMNAKQLVIGRAPEIGIVLHLAASSSSDFSAALAKFAAVSGVSGVLTVVVRNSQ